MSENIESTVAASDDRSEPDYKALWLNHLQRVRADQAKLVVDAERSALYRTSWLNPYDFTAKPVTEPKPDPRHRSSCRSSCLCGPHARSEGRHPTALPRRLRGVHAGLVSARDRCGGYAQALARRGLRGGGRMKTPPRLFPFLTTDDAPEPIKESQRAEIEPGTDPTKLAPRMASAALAKLKRSGKLPKRYSLKVVVKVTPR